MNVSARLEFEIAYHNVRVQRVSYNTSDNPLYSNWTGILDIIFVQVICINNYLKLNSLQRIIIIIIIVLRFWEFSTPELANGFSLKSEWQQVSSSLQDSSQYFGRFQQCSRYYSRSGCVDLYLVDLLCLWSSCGILSLPRETVRS